MPLNGNNRGGVSGAVPQLTGMDFIRDPQVIQQQIGLLYALRNMNVRLTVGQASQALASGVSQIVGNPPNLVLPLPLVSPNGAWALPTGTFTRATFDTATVTTAQLAQRVAALEQDLRAVGILPSA